MAVKTELEMSVKQNKSIRGLRQDEKALAIGISICVLLVLLVRAVSDRLAAVPHLPDAGAMWYYWILPEPTALTRLTVWLLYLSHQVLHWAMVYYGQKSVKYNHALQPFNYWMVGMNIFFIVIHLLQTHTTYDSLAQDTHILTALGSVAVMLIWVLLMENNRRGIFFGYAFPFPKDLVEFSRRYHGYYFSWAIVYNFWYHPMEGSLAHLSGLLYKFILLTHSCLIMTPIHRNKYWTTALEFMVLIHGTSVALFNYPETCGMFLFGFGLIFVVTQVHGLDLSYGVKSAVILLMTIGCLAFYSQYNFHNATEIFRIAVIDYLGVFVLAGILWCVKRCCEYFSRDNGMTIQS